MRDTVAIILMLATMAAMAGIVYPYKKPYTRKHFALLAFGLFVAFVVAVPKPTEAEQAATKIAEAQGANDAIIARSQDLVKQLVPYTKGEYPDTYKALGAKAFARLDELEPGAVYAAARSEQCDKPTYAAVSMERSKKDAPVWFVNCKNDNRFMIPMEEAEDALALVGKKALASTQRAADCTLDTVSMCNASKAQKEASEAEIVTFCDQIVEQALISEPDMKWSWDYRMGEGDDVRVVREFTAQNAYGAKLKHRYYCTVDTAQGKATSLKVEGPMGTETVI